MSNEMNRREMLKAGALAGAIGLTLGPSGLVRRAIAGGTGGAGAPPEVSASKARKRLIRVAHLTDMHIQPERKAFDGVGMCLRHMQSLPDKPELVLTGGDLIMDAFDRDATRTRLQWELFSKTLKDHCSLPVEHCLGNHDIWGWNKKKSGTTGEEGQWGKKWAMDVLGLSKPYRSFDKNGWRFVVLDSVFPNGDGYVGKLDDEQYAWLEALLNETPATTPVLVLSHIPIISIAPFTGPKDEVVKKHEGSISEMMSDMPRLVRLFNKHRNVKTCLSGHLHEVDRVEYQGVAYLCNGAVCGAWWKGKHIDCDEGYALVDLYDDGSVERTYQAYGWKATE